MSAAHTETIERIARVLAGLRNSMNGGGEEPSAAAEVDETWTGHVDDAIALLKALRDPDETMAQAGDARIWTKMIHAALGEAPPQPPSSAASEEIYQKPLG